jgi:hypothetical protein
MAYEGLDVPAITHIACLTHIRSKPWIEQMIARATRFDGEAGPWEEQMAYVYVPDDRFMNAIIANMQDEQQSVVKTRSEDFDESQLPLPERAAPEERNSIVPVGSAGHGRRWNRVGQHAPQVSTHKVPARTPSQLEADLRDKIQAYCKKLDVKFFGMKWGEANKRVVKTFGKNRTAMTLGELQRVMAWLQYHYPLDDEVAGRTNNGNSGAVTTQRVSGNYSRR